MLWYRSAWWQPSSWWPTTQGSNFFLFRSCFFDSLCPSVEDVEDHTAIRSSIYTYTHTPYLFPHGFYDGFQGVTKIFKNWMMVPLGFLLYRTPPTELLPTRIPPETGFLPKRDSSQKTFSPLFKGGILFGEVLLEVSRILEFPGRSSKATIRDTSNRTSPNIKFLRYNFTHDRSPQIELLKPLDSFIEIYKYWISFTYNFK